MMIKSGKVLKACSDDALANPKSDLYIAAFHDNYQKNVVGFAKSIDGGSAFTLKSDDSFSVGNSRSRYEGAVLVGHRITHDCCMLSDPVHKEDEFLEVVMDQLLEQWQEKVK
jgi:hypothetical protein